MLYKAVTESNFVHSHSNESSTCLIIYRFFDLMQADYFLKQDFDKTD